MDPVARNILADGKISEEWAAAGAGGMLPHRVG
jgi:hypothetical protein